MSIIDVARAIAILAHTGQVDKAGQPYIGHPERVAQILTAQPGNQNHEICAAWLHDVLEDTTVTSAQLILAGIPHPVIETVELLTRREHQTAEEYYAAIEASYSARRVKLADIADNSDVRRLALIDDDETIARLVRKYAKARLLLGGAE